MFRGSTSELSKNCPLNTAGNDLFSGYEVAFSKAELCSALTEKEKYVCKVNIPQKVRTEEEEDDPQFPRSIVFSSWTLHRGGKAEVTA